MSQNPTSDFHTNAQQASHVSGTLLCSVFKFRHLANIFPNIHPLQISPKQQTSPNIHSALFKIFNIPKTRQTLAERLCTRLTVFLLPLQKEAKFLT